MKDVKENKAETAIKAVKAMFPGIVAEAAQELVCEKTEDKFHSDFWAEQVVALTVSASHYGFVTLSSCHCVSCCDGS